MGRRDSCLVNIFLIKFALVYPRLLRGVDDIPNLLIAIHLRASTDIEFKVAHV